MPTTAVCPLCTSETVQLQENRADRPYFTCGTFDCTVNLRPGDNERAETLLEAFTSAESPDELESVTLGEISQVSDPDDSGDGETEVESPDGGETLADLLGGDDE